ncbi:zinc-dependent alcohol dehydrogenase family protein [Tunturibacter empetritectus]|uniref:NADPH:quinone reductase-like Zn-dependent oxidoreductase n=1 Tax=Tunturiibacter lichenicola TaxID=2051959 RepID=A0A7W8JAZ3_9BACT|nr:NAD(P)-dependent alcohol dehydrogenase [Edaphobacter lichenicola]MBB5345658.1 NADPH:quinone reductase-like Zn-dependent oxidoreductase [Edaphobacter lichenicola]
MYAFPVRQFGIDYLRQIDLPTPQTTPGTVLIKVHAVSLNYRDLMMVKGLYNPKMALPRIPCSDGAGEVVATGEGVTRVKAGDRVCGIFMQRWLDGPLTADKSKVALGGDVDGMLTEYALLDQEGVVRFPEHLTYEEAATLPCAGVTAWNALHHAGDPANPTHPEETVVIQGTGGVSIFALQFAKLLGARVLGTSSSEEKLSRARNLGLDEGCNYKLRPDWSKWVTETTANIGADRILEVGGGGTFGQSLRAARVGGTIAQIGVLSGAATSDPVALTPILHKQLRVQGIYVGSRAMFEQMNDAISKASLHPVIDKVFDFSHAAEAFAHMESASHFGKIVIRITSQK